MAFVNNLGQNVNFQTDFFFFFLLSKLTDSISACVVWVFFLVSVRTDLLSPGCLSHSSSRVPKITAVIAMAIMMVNDHVHFIKQKR